MTPAEFLRALSTHALAGQLPETVGVGSLAIKATLRWIAEDRGVHWPTSGRLEDYVGIVAHQVIIPRGRIASPLEPRMLLHAAHYLELGPPAFAGSWQGTLYEYADEIYATWPWRTA